MKPAPAISTLATAGLAGSGHERLGQFARILTRGFGEPHGEIAGEIAVLRVAGAFDLDARSPGWRRAAALRAAAASAWRSNFSIRVFKANPWVLSAKGRQFTAARARPLNLLPADRRRSTNAGPAARQRLDQRQPGASKSAARGSVRRFRSADARESDRPGAQSRRWPDPSTLTAGSFSARLESTAARRNASSPTLSLASARSMARRE